jgi:TonB family protein
MTAAVLLDNLLAWSAQVAVLVVVAAVAAMTLSHPRGRLIFWQGILAIALLIPVLEPWHQPAAEVAGPEAAAPSGQVVVVNHAHEPRFHWKREYLLFLAGAGSALRFLWIAAGLIRLRRHRLDSRMLTIPPVPFSNPRVRWFISSSVGGPVTFGILNPSILLPARVNELPCDLREAIAHHELAHVRRGDWLFVLLEEAIRSVLWFHPAIWFVLSRIQLAREQVVDAEVVGLTRDRERYLDALVAVAAQRLRPDLATAPLFLKKRQLAVRVAAVLKETRMSRSRNLLSFTTVCSAVFVATRLAVWMFPLQAPAQTPSSLAERGSIVADGPGVTVEPGAKILHRSPVFSPAGGTTGGTVIVESTVNSKGEVTDARIISGPDELRSAVLSSVLNWHFSTDRGLPPTVQSTVKFAAAQQAGNPRTVASSNLAPRIGRISFNGLSDDLAEKVRGSLPVHVGDPLGSEEIARVRLAVKEVDRHLMVGTYLSGPDVTLMISLPSQGGVGTGIGAGTGRGVIGGVPGGVSGGVINGVPGGVLGGVGGVLRSDEPSSRRGVVTSDGGGAPTAEAAVGFPPPVDGVTRIRVGGNVQAANLIKKVTPLYPPLAKQARIQGVVRLTALIDTQGNIAGLQLVSGHPLLVTPAQEAVQQWKYSPTLLDGTPVEVITQIDVNFTLSQ